MARIRIENDEKKSPWISRIIITTFIALIFLNFPAICQSHDNDHHHGHDHHEPASFKYSREANENFKKHDSLHDHHHHHDNVENEHKHDEEHKHDPHWRPTSDYVNQQGDIFVRAMGCTLLISIAPFVILFFVPLDNSKQREPLLKILLSFASGGLLGDAFLHLIPGALTPHSEEEHEHSHGHEHGHGHGHGHSHGHGHDMSVGLSVLMGIIVFLTVEKLIRIIKGNGAHSHSHSAPAVKDKKISDKKNDGKKSDKDAKVDIKIAGYLNLAADFMHNFTDGLAIGASFLAGETIGYVTTLSILLHEVPHEIGDFAILIQSGCNKKKAMLLQLVTAFGALLGTYVSLLADGMGDLATKWILPFTAGGFIYIATVSVIPELLSDTKFWQSVKEIIALLFGVYMMVLIAQYE